MWPSGFDPNATDIGMALQVINAARKSGQIWREWFTNLAADNNFYAFTRGEAFLVTLTNGGYGSNQVKYTINSPGLKTGIKYCNVFWPTQDCFNYDGSALNVYLNHGEAKIYIPSTSIDPRFYEWNVFQHKDRYFANDSDYTTMF